MEVELRWKGNKIIEGNTHLGTLRELYAYHKALPNADQYIPRSMGSKKQVLPSIHLELLINISTVCVCLHSTAHISLTLSSMKTVYKPRYLMSWAVLNQDKAVARMPLRCNQ